MIDALVMKFNEIKKGGGRSFLFFYMAGYGVLDSNQCLVTNTDEEKQLLKVETKLRVLASQCSTSVFAIYDACTVETK